MTDVRVKLFHGGCLPERMTEGAAGWDCRARESGVVASQAVGRIALGFAVELPPGWEMVTRGRSGLAGRGVMAHVGTVDSDYRGEVHYIFYNAGAQPWRYEHGERVCQVVFQKLPEVRLVEVAELGETARGAGGFGSTDGLKKLQYIMPIDRCPRCDGFHAAPPESSWRCICT